MEAAVLPAMGVYRLFAERSPRPGVVAVAGVCTTGKFPVRDNAATSAGCRAGCPSDVGAGVEVGNVSEVVEPPVVATDVAGEMALLVPGVKPSVGPAGGVRLTLDGC